MMFIVAEGTAVISLLATSYLQEAVTETKIIEVSVMHEEIVIEKRDHQHQQQKAIQQY